MTALAKIESELSSLRGEVHELKGSIGPGLRAPIQSLAPEPFEVVSPMEAVIRPAEDGFIASFFDANVSASGDTQTEAFANLKDLIVATFEELSRLGEERLGPGPKRQLAVLKRFVSSRKS